VLFDDVKSISFIFSCHQLPDCSLNVRLSVDFHASEFINTTVEVFGEVRLYDDTSTSSELESSHSLIQKLGNLQTKLEESKGLPPRFPTGTNDKSLHHSVKCKLQKEIEDYKKRFKPMIQVHTMKHIQEAREIITENLRFRQIQNFRKTRQL
jgi:hypothetical protein